MFGPAPRGRGTALTPPSTPPVVDGNVVWHFTNGPGLVSILTQHVLWATSASFLNDQQEVALGGELIVRRLLELGEAEGADSYFAAMAQRVREGVDHGHGPSPASFFILSASQAWDSLVMWRNYGGAQESYAIGLDADAPLRVLGDPTTDPARYAGGLGSSIHVRRTRWEPVRYDEAEQLALVDAVFDGLPGELMRFRDRVGEASHSGAVNPGAYAELDDARDDLEQALLLIKHSGFVDERETRQAIVLWTADEPEAQSLEASLVRYRSTPYGMAPYVELTGPAASATSGDDGPVARAPAPLPIRAVAISPSPNGDEATESLRGLLTSRGYAGVPVLRSAIPFRG
ncbi:hypothetical protein [Knoellia sp. LjRoot47]|uniref:hypothetical protein n=1 Tax=Knoellia sp. LjRoot47 TaxID=3342330 RepID=UPI003ED115F5